MAAHQTRLTRTPRARHWRAAGLLAALLLAAPPWPPLTAQPASPPARIVSVVPSVTELLFAIGAGSRVVGVSTFDEHPADVAGVPRVGGLIDPSVERILSLAPDLVVVYGTQTDLRTQLDRAGIAQLPYLNSDIPGITALMRELGRRLGLEARANQAADTFEARLAAVRRRVAGLPRPRVLVVFGHDPGSLRSIEAAGRIGFHHDMLEVAGAASVLADVNRVTVQLTTEDILRLAPDAIVDLHYGATEAAGRDAERALWGRLAAVPAVRAGRVHLLTGDEFVVPGPRLAEATERLGRILHPEAFAP